jgi:hypothetical protein
MKAHGVRGFLARTIQWWGLIGAGWTTRRGAGARILASVPVLALAASTLSTSGPPARRPAGTPVVARGALLGCGSSGPDGITPASATGRPGTPPTRRRSTRTR